MPSTTVHIPDKLLAELDAVVKDKGISRNRFIMEACRRALEQEAGRWPAGFFEYDMGPDNLKLLKRAVDEMEKGIRGMRRNRSGVRL